jgi:hypothetical protein
MGIDSHLSTCVGTQSPKYLEMAQGHISLSGGRGGGPSVPPLGLTLMMDAHYCFTNRAKKT